jgi:redox-sensitive bicupin YhaK (pirin superfamily)
MPQLPAVGSRPWLRLASMSGPVSPVDAPGPGAAAVEPPVVEVLAARETTVGSLPVQRALPRRRRRTVGAWCFVDHFGPASVDVDGGLDIGPHPHTGLQTVTYLTDGQVLHRDSLGSEQVIRPGQLNLMTAGRGVVHAEEPTRHYRGLLHGVQLWVAQPDATRGGEAAFEHHGELPQLELPGALVTVLVGEVAGVRSPARRDSDHLGADVLLRAGTTVLPLEPSYEHALVVLDGVLVVDDRPLVPGETAYLGVGREQVVVGTAEKTTRILLLGGTPFDEPLLMWWNFVARSREEVAEAQRQWVADDRSRFGAVATGLARVPAPAPPWAR